MSRSRVNLNHASPEFLALLPEIGPKKVEYIVKRRAEKRFDDVLDILKCRGVNRAAYEKFKHLVTVTEPTVIYAEEVHKTVTGAKLR